MSKFEKYFLNSFLVYILVYVEYENIKMRWFEELNEEYQAGIKAFIFIIVIALLILMVEL